ncbi:hypothetical protein JHK87_016765 [Glycine soja]|nr:hypothetical protein JHK87_016765 [Glycine soja]KAG5047463.1 hypothetical protein JHK86_016869 [Glycine max]
MKMSLLDISEDDTRLWRFTGSGDYTVRSTYDFIMEKFVDIESLSKDGDWLCRDCLPTKCNMRSRSVECLMMCPLCDVQMEISSHTFLQTIDELN